MNALDMIQQALANWRALHGSESLYEQCQRFEGYYISWAYAGTDSGIHVYDSARHAGDASPIFDVAHVNDPSILPGDSVYWWWGDQDHICTAFGWDGSRLLVSNTADGGDDLGDLGNHVKISHADTIDLSFRGVAHRNGVNIERAGVQQYPTHDSGGDIDVHTIYQDFLDDQPVKSSWTYLYLNAAHDISVAAGPVSAVWGELHISFSPSGTVKPGDALQVRPVVDTLDSHGNRTAETSLGVQEIGMTSGSWAGFVALPVVELGSGQRVRFQVTGPAGKITGAVFRGARV